MSNKIDIVINYCSADNVGSGESKGWIDNFKDFLEAMLFQVLGEKPTIELLDEKADIVPQASIMVCVLSPNFIESDKCTGKIERWHQDIKDEQNSEITRIFKVLKLPIEIQNQPPGLSTYLGYDLFYVDEDTK